MRVVLRVVGGKNDGREIGINIPEFIIGRGDEAHLRPGSDLVSRKHCSITKEGGKVMIKDMGSRNGTFVNGEKLEGPHEARKGDKLRVGRLQFELIVDHAKPAAKKPKVDGVVEAAARTASAATKKSSLEDSVTDWLMDGDDDEREPTTDIKKIITNAETVQMNLSETTIIDPEDSTSLGNRDSDEDLDTVQEIVAPKETPKKKKKEFGKLPPIPKFSHDDSTTAADDVLRKFFNRR